MTTSRIRTAAGACFLSALLGAGLLPSVAWAPDQRLANSIALVSMALYVFILLTFREALAQRHGYRMPSWLVTGLIFGHLGLALSSVLDDITTVFAPVSIALVWAASVVVALSLICLGAALLKLRAQLGWLGVLLAVLLAIEGLLFGTIVFMANAILLAVVTDVLTGWLLLRLSDERLATFGPSRSAA